MIAALAWLGGLAWFAWDWLRSSLRCRPPAGRTIEEAYRIGVQSLPVLLVISTFVGTNLALQGYEAFTPLGGQRLVGMFVAMAGIRELAPLIAAAMVAAKAGTEMASQIAVMRTREQIDALEVMAVNPYWFLVTPRLYGIVLVMPALSLIAVAVTVLSSFLVSVFQLGLNPATFLEFARTSTRMGDILAGSVKAVIFAVIICFVSCYCGFVSEKGPTGVGRATNRAVVVSCITCVMFNTLVSQVLYG
jgi:phospholipid/cholesterol/gamma-HCH transport system permease protein